MIAPFILAAALLQPPTPTTPPAAPAPPAPARPAPIAQWDSAGFTPPKPTPEMTALTDPASAIIERLLHTGGLLGGGAKDGGGATTWLFDGQKLNAISAAPQASARFAELPENWLTLDAARKESALLALTVDANALRASTEPLFDAPWMQRLIDRLALNNARTISLRAALLPAPTDGLPPVLELKVVASARSDAPGSPMTALTLISPRGKDVSSAEVAAIKGANWAASIRSDSAGLGQIGRDGGVGTWAGLVRLAVDAIGTAQTTDTAAWAKEHHTWSERTTDALRTISTRLQPRATLACYGSAAAPDLVMVIPGRFGERADTLTKAMDQLATATGMSSKQGIWTNAPAPTSKLTPRIAVTISDSPSGVFLIVALEHDAKHALLLETAARLRNAK